MNSKVLFCLSIFFLLSVVKIRSQTISEALSFEVKIAGEKVKFVWEISTESNVKQYNVYRSVDHVNYFLIGEIPSKNRKHLTRYEHLDHTASGGINYYKLEAIGLDQTVIILKYSKIDIEDKEKAIDITPIVEIGNIKLLSAEQIFTMELTLTDMLNRDYPLSYVTDSTHELTIITGPIAPGAYVLTCHINGVRYTRKKAMFIY